jgi:two-component system phosphate regulon sensor histidine kinase PhoR
LPAPHGPRSPVMNVRKIWLITILMSAALVGIILVQAWYVSNAIRLRRTIFHQQVLSALHDAVDRMDRHRAAELLRERSDWRLLSQQAFEPIDTGAVARDLTDSLLEDYLASGEPIPIELPDLTVPLPGPDGPAASPGGRRFTTDPFSISSTVYAVEQEDYNAVLPALLKNTQDQVVANVRRFNALVGDVMVELLRGKYGPTRRVDPHLMDSLIGEELRHQGIQAPYVFGVSLGGSQLVTNVLDEAEETALLGSPHRVPLSPGNLFAGDGEDLLYVRFPSEERYVLQSVWTVLTGSGLFTLVIILGFTYTITALLRQKKVADIKNDFINNMTHEFKTPIATISLAVDSMANPRISGDPERVKRYTGIIRDENRRMNAQVEKVLQMALLDRNEIKLSREPLDLHHVAQTAADAMAIQVASKGGRIDLELQASRTGVYADEVHVTNVVQNLLDNANKYSPEAPRIRIETWNDQRGVYLAVVDHGIGMDRETRQRIFEKFYRLPKGNVHDVKGFGLGLTYVKAILDAHGGAITVKSQPGKGSRFIIYLPTHP